MGAAAAPESHQQMATPVSEELANTAEGVFRDFLRERGLKYTPERAARRVIGRGRRRRSAKRNVGDDSEDQDAGAEFDVAGDGIGGDYRQGADPLLRDIQCRSHAGPEGNLVAARRMCAEDRE